MKVKATKQGFYGKLIAAGEVFDVDEGVTGSWFEPVQTEPAEPAAAPKKATARKTPAADDRA